MKMSRKTGNHSGCRKQTRNVDEGIGDILENLEGYICDKLCFYSSMHHTKEDLERFCDSCKMHEKVNEIEAEYEKINDFSESAAYNLMGIYRKFVFCKDCRHSQSAGKPGTYLCRLQTGLLEVLKENDGCSLGELKEDKKTKKTKRQKRRNGRKPGKGTK